MKRYALILCLPALLTWEPALATTAMGIGTRDCTAFLRAREIGSEQAIDSYVAWGLGYLTGRNAAMRGRRPVLVDGGGLAHWLSAWCKQNPAAPVFDGLETFARESGG